MKRISSALTIFHKKYLPLVFFSGLGAVAIGSVVVSDPAEPAVPGVAVGLALFALVLFRLLVWDLADEVYDCGDHLLVRFRGAEHRLPIGDIVAVRLSFAQAPRRITLHLDHAGPFGDKLAFMPVQAFSIDPAARNSVADDLWGRVEIARGRRAG